MCKLHKLSSLYNQHWKCGFSNFFKSICLKPDGWFDYCTRFSSVSKLEHIGIFSETQTKSNYDTGQIFLHRVFAYRGVVLQTWKARIYDKSCHMPVITENKRKQNNMKMTIPKLATYYQVLVDSRDTINNSAICEISYLKSLSRENYPIEKIPGIDYVLHGDIIPYTPVEEIPISHDLYDKFITRKGLLLEGTQTLQNWQEKNRVWLEMSSVYSETTNNIRVTVIPFYLGVKSHALPPVYWWRYIIRIENHGGETVQLRKRQWRIVSDGNVTKLPGRGVIGKEPILDQKVPAFQYSSQVPLGTPNGFMWGSYSFEKEDGSEFEVCIPAFALKSKLESNSDSTNDIS